MIIPIWHFIKYIFPLSTSLCYTDGIWQKNDQAPVEALYLLSEISEVEEVFFVRVEDLRYLLRVVDMGSINQAADASYITQQGLSRIINSLEKEIGVKLFHRSNNRIVLTAAGEIAVSWARELDAIYQRMLSDISRCSHQMDGTHPIDCHIYTSRLISSTILPRILSTLNLQHPGAHLDVVELLPPEIADEVEYTGNCIAITSLYEMHEAQSIQLSNGNLVFEKFFQDELMLSVSEHSPLASREIISARELATIPLSLCGDEPRIVREILGSEGEPSIALNISSYELSRQIVSRNQAAGITSALRDHYSSLPTRAIPLDKSIKISYGCIYAPALPHPPIIQDLIKIVKNELSHIRPERRG